MKQHKLKKNTKKAMPKSLMAKKPLKIKTGEFVDNFWSWVPGMGDAGDK